MPKTAPGGQTFLSVPSAKTRNLLEGRQTRTYVPSPADRQECLSSYACHFPSVKPFHESVRNGDAGRPSLLARFGSVLSRQAKRTATGAETSGLDTMTLSPSISAVAGRNF